jgi:hypothetical protein
MHVSRIDILSRREKKRRLERAAFFLLPLFVDFADGLEMVNAEAGS